MEISREWHTRADDSEVDPFEADETAPCRDDGFGTVIHRKRKRDYGEDRNSMPGAGKHADGRVRKKSKAVAKRRK